MQANPFTGFNFPFRHARPQISQENAASLLATASKQTNKSLGFTGVFENSQGKSGLFTLSNPSFRWGSSLRNWRYCPSPSPIFHLLSSISHPSCILYTESSESFSCILFTECSESWTADSLARTVDT